MPAEFPRLRAVTLRICNSPIKVGQSICRYASTGPKIFQENDVVLLRSTRTKSSVLSKPLRAINGTIPVDRGFIETADIIGKKVRDVVHSTKGLGYRLLEPSLAEYADLSPRLVTPIYSQDTNLIVSLLDLHPSTPGGENCGGHDGLEIFEAGTGHGSLTLSLARAIHVANTPAPPIFDALKEYQNEREELQAKELRDAYSEWRSNRRAIIHTLDQSSLYSKFAQQTVRNFRRGMYFPNVDFHVGSIEGYLTQRLLSSNTFFLDHAILDLPNTHQYLDIVGKALKPNGLLITWNPSITQANKCVTTVKEHNMPFLMEKVIEVGQGLNGGREWDVRLVRPRASSQAKAEAQATDSFEPGVQSASESEAEPSDIEVPPSRKEEMEMVCRPKVGLRVAGGGFITLWRKMERQTQDS